MQGCLVLRFQPGWASGEGTAFEFLPLPSAIEAAAYDASFSWRTSGVSANAIGLGVSFDDVRSVGDAS